MRDCFKCNINDRQNKSGTFAKNLTVYIVAAEALQLEINIPAEGSIWVFFFWICVLSPENILSYTYFLGALQICK